MGAVDKPEVSSVVKIEDLHRFVHYYHGTQRGPTAHIRFWKGFEKFLEKHPEWQGRGIGFAHLAKVCEWGVRTNKGRVGMPAFLLYWVEDAVKVGLLPDLEVRTDEEKLEDDFYSILAIEDDPQWRKYLIGTEGKLRKQAIEEWKEDHGPKETRNVKGTRARAKGKRYPDDNEGQHLHMRQGSLDDLT